MADLTEQLAAVAAGLQIAGIPGSVRAGRQIVARIAPPLGRIAFTDIVEHPVGLDLILKQVVFTDRNFAAPGTSIADPAWIADPDITKILPMFNLAAGAIPALDDSGVPGLIGRLKGSLPVAVPGEAIPKMSVTWSVTDDDGDELEEGEDYLAPNGLDGPTLDIVFLPVFEPFDGGAPAVVARRLSARVTLSAGGATVLETVGPIRIRIPAIPFPKVLALTLHTDFKGAALILVPADSGVNSIDHLRAVLQPVRNVISTLTGIARFARMIAGIDTLTGILEATNKEFRKGDRFDNLNDITLIQRGFFENDTEAEDELSAFVYLSPPSRPRRSENSVEMCNARNLATGDGAFTVDTGNSFVALCRSLHHASPEVTPREADLRVGPAPPGGFFRPSTFGDELSSMRFL